MTHLCKNRSLTTYFFNRLTSEMESSMAISSRLGSSSSAQNATSYIVWHVLYRRLRTRSWMENFITKTINSEGTAETRSKNRSYISDWMVVSHWLNWKPLYGIVTQDHHAPRSSDCPMVLWMFHDRQISIVFDTVHIGVEDGRLWKLRPAPCIVLGPSCEVRREPLKRAGGAKCDWHDHLEKKRKKKVSDSFFVQYLSAGSWQNAFGQHCSNKATTPLYLPFKTRCIIGVRTQTTLPFDRYSRRWLKFISTFCLLSNQMEIRFEHAH